MVLWHVREKLTVNNSSNSIEQADPIIQTKKQEIEEKRTGYPGIIADSIYPFIHSTSIMFLGYQPGCFSQHECISM